MNALRKYSLHLAAIALSIVYVVLGHVDYWPAKLRGGTAQWEVKTPTLTSGDEPHYLMVVHSILYDHDIRLDDDYASIHSGGWEAGIGARGSGLGGHTLIVDERSGKHVMCIVPCTEKEYAAIGVPQSQTFQVPTHPIGYPLLMALLLAPLRPSPPQVEPLVGFFSIIIAILGVVLTYLAAVRSGLERRHAMGAALLLGFASTWIVYLRSYFSDPSIGLFILFGYLALRRGAFVRAGLAIGVTIAMKSVFVLVGFAWILERLWARRIKDAFILAVTIGICSVLIIASNMVLLRTAFVGGALPLEFTSGLNSLKETFFVPDHGLALFIPWAPIAFFWAPYAARPGAVDQPGTLAVTARRQMALTIFFLLAVFAVLAYGPGWCNGPRYYIPLLPFLAILTMDFVASGRRWRMAVVGVLGLVSAVIAIPSVPQYHWLFSTTPFQALTGPK